MLTGQNTHNHNHNPRQLGSAWQITWLLLLFFSCSLHSAYLIENQHVLETIKKANGEGFGGIFALEQTSDGTIWIGTENGLGMMQGNSYREFLHDPSDPNSLSHNHIRDLLVDNQQQLWISTYGGGINILDLNTLNLTHLNQGKAPLGLSSRFTNQMDFVGDHSIAVGTTRGIDLIDIKTLQVRQLLADATSDLAYMNLYLAAGNNGDIWFSSYGSGLHKVNSNTLELTTYQTGQQGGINLLSNNVLALYHDSRDRLWVGTDKGINLVSGDGYDSQTIYLESDHVHGSNNVLKFYEDLAGKVWLSIQNKGVYVFDEKSFTIQTVGNSQQNTPAFNALGVSDIIQSRSGDFFLATRSHGLVTFSEYFDAFTHKSLSGTLDKKLNISHMLRDSLGNTWIAAGQSLYQLEDQTLVEVLEDSGYIYALDESRDGILYYSSIGNGLLKFDPAEPVSIGNPQLVYPDSDENILEFAVGAEGQLLLVYNGIRQNLTLMVVNGKEVELDLGATNIPDLIKVAENAYLIAVKNQNNQAQGQIVYFQFNDSLAAPTIETLVQNVNPECVIGLRARKVWFCQEQEKGGIAFYDQDSKTFTSIQARDGLASDFIRTATMDSAGNVWIATDNGISVVLAQNHTLFNFSSMDGMGYAGFADAPAVGGQGQLVFPALQGLLLINEDRLRQHLIKAQNTQHTITFSDLKILNKSAIYGSTPAVSHEPMQLRSQLPLSFEHDQFLISFEFTGDHFSYRNRISYEHRLLGLNERWVQSNFQQNQAAFSQLTPGDYELQVRAIDPNSQQPQPISSLQFSVLPPWWQTWWAKLFYLLTAAAAIALLHHYRLRRIRRYAQELEQGIAARTHELSQSKDTIEGLLKQKLTLFSNVSHEFRTPLTIVMGHLQALSKEPLSRFGQNRLQTIKRSSLGLLKLVEQLMNLSELDNAMPQQKRVYDVELTLQAVLNALSVAAESKHHSLSLQCEPFIYVELQEDSLEKIALNLVHNAIKYCEKDCAISVSVAVVNGLCKIKVCDNGQGIAAEYLDQIFERFVRINQDGKIPGSGIGLALVKELVQANNGSISVHSEVGRGTEFTVSLPIFGSSAPPIGNAEANHGLLSNFSQALATMSQPHTDDGNGTEGEDEDKDKNAAAAMVLIVEDNQDLADFIAETLNGFRCLRASNGEEGLSVAKAQIPDIIVSDILMPKMDGIALLKEIRSNTFTAHIPVVLLTAMADEQSRIKGWQENVDDYITKPFSPNELKARVENLLELRNLLQRRFTEAVLDAPNSNPYLANENTKSVEFDNLADQKFYLNFSKIIEDNYHQDSFSRSEAAVLMAVSERQLNRKLNALFGHNFTDFLRQFRLNKACALLAEGHQITEVCYAVGFNSPSYFGSRFKAAQGMTPTEYQAKMREPI